MDLFDKFNDRFFGSKLPSVPVLKFDPADPVTLMMIGYPFQVDGVCWHDGIIGVANDLNSMNESLTLLHEMIHLQQVVEGRKVNHGKFFKRRCREILEEL